MTGQTVTLEGNVPKICYDGCFVPICGRYFWDTNFGARLFCKMLGRNGGRVSKPEINLVEDAYYVGKCSSTDTHINACTGGRNQRTLGGKSGISASCDKGSEAEVHINCDGEVFLIIYNTLKLP